MKLVAIVRSPEVPEEAARVLAEASGLALAEARMRLAPEPPALLARMEPAGADALVASLRKAGLAALAIPARVPSDGDRLVARAFALDPDGASFTSRSGASVSMAWPDVVAVLRGLRAQRSETERSERSRSLSVGRAIATGGLSMTRDSTRTVRSSEESTEQVILVYSRSGPVACLAERTLDFSCLGPGMGPSSTANMVELGRLLRARTGAAFHDERLLRLGRRPLAFLARGQSSVRSAASTVVQTDTGGVLDVLAEVLHQAVREGLLRP